METLIGFAAYIARYLVDIIVVLYGVSMVLLSQVKLKEKHPSICAWLQTIGILVILLYIRAIRDGAIK